MTFNSAKNGFSLIELMVVISIIGVISAVSLGSLSIIQKNNRDAKRQADLRLIQGALQQYYADQNMYPNALEGLADGSALTNCTGKVLPCTVTKTYLSNTPKDPQGTAYSYRPVIDVGHRDDTCAVGVGVCQYYFMCAKFENQAAGNTCWYSGSYNFQVTAL